MFTGSNGRHDFSAPFSVESAKQELSRLVVSVSALECLHHNVAHSPFFVGKEDYSRHQFQRWNQERRQAFHEIACRIEYLSSWIECAATVQDAVAQGENAE
jgi:hypothetical protein